MVDSVQVRVVEYEPVRSASVAPMCCLNDSGTAALETGADHVFGAQSTTSGDGSVKVPLVRWSGPENDSAASPAVDVTVAVVDAV